MTKLDKMRQKQVAKAPGQQAEPGPTPIGNTQTIVNVPRTAAGTPVLTPINSRQIRDGDAVSVPKPPKEKKPPAEKVIIGYEPVAHACGHTFPFKLYALPDTYRDARRKKHADQKCGNCKNAEHSAQQQARAAAENPDGKSKKEMRAHWKDGAGRLPDGSSFAPAPVWDATAKQWSGGLRIGKEGEGGPTFETTAGGVMGLFRALDLMYRAYLRRQAKDATGEAQP